MEIRQVPRWSPGKDGGEEEEKLLFLRRKSIFQQLESVFGGVLLLLPNVVTSPYFYDREQEFLNKMRESERDSKKATVFCGIVNIGLFVVFDILSSVLDKESVDSKVLVQMQINQIQKESL